LINSKSVDLLNGAISNDLQLQLT